MGNWLSVGGWILALIAVRLIITRMHRKKGGK